MATQQNVGDARSFHGLASYYRRIDPNFSSLALPLNELVKKDTPFCWMEKHEQAFQRLKAQLTNAPILALPNSVKKIELECDALGVGIGVGCCKVGTQLHILLKNFMVQP